MKTATLFLLVLGLGVLATPCRAQTWTVMGNEICSTVSGLPNSSIKVPQQTQCFSWGTINQLDSPAGVDSAYQQYLSYRAGQQLGQGVSALVGAIVLAWRAHHQKVVVEKKNVQGEIRAYLRANMAMFDEGIASVQQSGVLLKELSALPNPTLSQSQTAASLSLLPPMVRILKQSRESMRAYECKWVAGKHRLADLRYVLNARGGAKWEHTFWSNKIVKEWIYDRVLAFALATKTHTPIIPAPEITESYANVCSE